MILESDEVLANALRAHGVRDIAQLRAENSYGEEYRVGNSANQPMVYIDHLHHPQHMRITWRREGKIILYESDPEGEIVTVKETSLPDAVLSSLTGKPLSQVVAIPGAESRIVEVAVNSKAFVSDPLDLRIALIEN